MTYKTFKNLLTGMLIGDNTIPRDDDVILSLLEYAFTTIATKADSLRLMSVGSESDILRLAQEGYLIRFPEMPLTDDSTLDIDQELCYPAARLVASILSKNKPQEHAAIADREIKDYNAKVYELMSTIQNATEEIKDNTLPSQEEIIWPQ